MSIAMQDVGVQGLESVGFQWSDRVDVHSRVRQAHSAVAFSLESSKSADLIVDTAAARPDHAAVLFITGRVSQHPGLGDAVRSYVMHAPGGAIAQVRCRGRWRVTGALVDRPTVQSFVPNLPWEPRLFTEHRPLERSMLSFIDVILAATEAPSSIERYAIAQLLTEMGGAVLLDRNGVTPTDPGEILRQRALAFITQQSRDPNFTPSAVAREMQVSLRKLQAVFADAGSSLYEAIRRQRAGTAHALLTDSRYRTLGVDQVAERAGFRSTMTLRRALHDVYQTRPSALRRP
jgi:AraC-like DNA-binding protein